MKHLAAIIIAAFLLCGCGRDHFQTQSFAWWNGCTNLQLNIIYKSVYTKTNVDTLEQAVNILGQYGWQLTSVTGDNDANRIMYLQRRYRGNDECLVSLVPPSP